MNSLLIISRWLNNILQKNTKLYTQISLSLTENKISYIIEFEDITTLCFFHVDPSNTPYLEINHYIPVLEI